MKKKLEYAILILTVIITCSSCKKFTEIDRPKDKILTAQVFSNDKTAMSALYAVYSHIGKSHPDAPNFIGMMSSRTGSFADEFVFGLNIQTEAFCNNNLTAETLNSSYMWSDAYNLIYKTNAIIEGVTNSTQLSEKVRKTMLGEAYFMRAYYYFHLVNLFGPLPMAITTDFEKNRLLNRSPEPEVYKQILADLVQSASQLDESMVTGEMVRPDIWAVRALLSRVHLYMGNWPEAAKSATQLIGSGRFKLEPALTDVFLISSKEAILQFSAVNTGFASFEADMIPFMDNIPNYPLTAQMIAAYETNDKRRQTWVGTQISNGTTYYFAYKYKSAYIGTGEAPERTTILRLAEQYLIRAEARAMQNDLEGCRNDINQIRTRAGLPEIVLLSSKEEALTAILQERKIELMAENGHRWFDLKRYKLADSILKTVKGNNWQEVPDLLWPLPVAELRFGINLIQNPGYN